MDSWCLKVVPFLGPLGGPSSMRIPVSRNCGWTHFFGPKADRIVAPDSGASELERVGRLRGTGFDTFACVWFA